MSINKKIIIWSLIAVVIMIGGCKLADEIWMHNIPTQPRATFAPTRAPVTVELPQMPQEYKYAIGARIYSRYTFADIKVETKRYFENYTVVLKVSGEKTGDFDGAEGTHNGYICFKLYDAEGYVVETGTIMLQSYAIGDKFRNVEEYIFDVPAGHYRLELMDYR